MKLIYTEPNQNRAYPPIQTARASNVIPPGMALWPEDLQTDTFFNHNGFVMLTVEDVDGVPTVTAYEPNMEAWEAWKATLPEETATAYVTTETQKLRADIDYLSMMTGVDLPT